MRVPIETVLAHANPSIHLNCTTIRTHILLQQHQLQFCSALGQVKSSLSNLHSATKWQEEGEDKTKRKDIIITWRDIYVNYKIENCTSRKSFSVSFNVERSDNSVSYSLAQISRGVGVIKSSCGWSKHSSTSHYCIAGCPSCTSLCIQPIFVSGINLDLHLIILSVTVAPFIHATTIRPPPAVTHYCAQYVTLVNNQHTIGQSCKLIGICELKWSTEQPRHCTALGQMDRHKPAAAKSAIT